MKVFGNNNFSNQINLPKIDSKNIDFNKIKNGRYCGKKFHSIKKQLAVQINLFFTFYFLKKFL